MAGQEYLRDIRDNLRDGRHQHRMGENVLRAFGYVRRRATAIKEINATLDCLGLVADPAIDPNMPPRSPRIRFSLKDAHGPETTEAADGADALDSNSIDESYEDAVVEDDEEDEDDGELPEPAFSVSELESSGKCVAWVSPDESIQTAYTKMLLNKYSQLVVASQAEPFRQDIKGIVSFQSMTKALMNGRPAKVGDCIDNSVPIVQSDADLNSVVEQLKGHDVVLVIGRERRLQGIVTAWDLAEEFAELVDPFNRIGEIEQRLQTLLRRRLGTTEVAEFLSNHGRSGDDQIEELEQLTLGELQRVLEYPDHWIALKLPFERTEFIQALNKAREYRNRLMHFRDPLDEAERMHLTNLCDMVREIQL